jgi:hypothetical protein
VCSSVGSIEEIICRTITQPRLACGNDERLIIRQSWSQSTIERLREEPRQFHKAFSFVNSCRIWF